MLLFAQEQQVEAWKWWFDFAGRWGDTFGIVGFAITVVGFPTTWWMQSRIKSETKKAIHKVALIGLRESLQKSLWQLGAAKQAINNGWWHLSLDQCDGARQTILLALSNPHILEDENEKLRANADDLILVAAYIRKTRMVPNPPPGFQAAKWDAIEKMCGILIDIQNRLNAVVWEV